MPLHNLVGIFLNYHETAKNRRHGKANQDWKDAPNIQHAVISYGAGDVENKANDEENRVNDQQNRENEEFERSGDSASW